MTAPPPTPPAIRYRGHVVYLYAYDLAYDMTGQPQTLLGQPLRQFNVGPSKRSPRELFFYRPMMLTLPPVERTGPRGKVQVERVLKLFPVGAISISVRVPFEVADGQELVDYHELEFAEGPLHEEVQKLAEQVRQELAPYCLRPTRTVRNEEAYTVFCLNAPVTADDGKPVSGESWLNRNRRYIAALLTQEQDAASLSAQEALESTGKFLSYYESDLAVIDWDAALLVDKPENFDEILHIMELANVQLAELEEYDRLLDDAMERSYRDLARSSFRGRSDVLAGLREIRIDLARLSDEISNTTKFFGDWHLSRIYSQLSARFHLADWQKVIDEKLKTLDSLYQLLKQDQLNRWMLWLEVAIVLLFVLDLIVLVLPVMQHK